MNNLYFIAARRQALLQEENALISAVQTLTVDGMTSLAAVCEATSQQDSWRVYMLVERLRKRGVILTYPGRRDFISLPQHLVRDAAALAVGNESEKRASQSLELVSE